jgi:arsenate reductase
VTALLIVYGLKNCDTCRKARALLARHEVEHQFIDVATNPPDAATIATWLETLGEDRLINRRGNTWRALDVQARGRSALELLTEQPKLMKRPILVRGHAVINAGAEADWLAFACGD